MQRLGLALEKCTCRCGHGSWKCICARLGSFTYIPSWLPGSWKKHYCMKHLFAWFLEVCVLVTRFLCGCSRYLALWCMVLGTVPAAMIYNSVYNARSWRRLMLGNFSSRRGRLVLGYVASGSWHLPAIAVAWLLELYLLS